MIDQPRLACALSLLILLVVGCSAAPESPQETAAGPADTAIAEPAGPVPPVGAEDQPSEPEPAAPDEEPSPQPTPPAASEPAPEPPAETSETEPPSPAAGTGGDSSGVVDPGGPVEMAATKPDLTRVGVAKCKLCHKVQHASWSETAHAKRTPPLDCESCHGPGSEYKGLAVMKDPEKSRAAGLVDPTEAFCSQCHKSGWSEEMMRRSHAHKDEES